MFDLFAMVLSSLASFLFPIFASYKALKTSDPAQLTPWLMYWVVFSCCLLVESWLSFILTWIPFYGYFRLLFLLYLILPQTQGARIIYEEHVHPFLEDNEAQIDEFIANAHDRLRAAGAAYLKRAIEYLKTQVLGLPPSEPTPEPADAQPQSYTQSLLARFSVPTARWSGAPASAAATGNDFYNLLASAVSAATAAATTKGDSATQPRGASLIPDSLQDSREKMTFIAAQRERLNILLSALDREAKDIERSDDGSGAKSVSKDPTPPDRVSRSMAFDGNEDEEPTQRPPSGLSMLSGLSKSRSEADFEKIEAESGAEDEDRSLRRRRGKGSVNDEQTTPSAATGSWIPWGWGTGNGSGATGAHSGAEQ
ncbi:TB2/DP1, HVA22 family protein [Sarocladium implicatum]|nr:TB2/DP1, HVA22 family protein [Sarocladium implicatum]